MELAQKEGKEPIRLPNGITVTSQDPNYSNYLTFLKNNPENGMEVLGRHLELKARILKIENRMVRGAFLDQLALAWKSKEYGRLEGTLERHDNARKLGEPTTEFMVPAQETKTEEEPRSGTMSVPTEAVIGRPKKEEKKLVEPDLSGGVTATGRIEREKPRVRMPEVREGLSAGVPAEEEKAVEVVPSPEAPKTETTKAPAQETVPARQEAVTDPITFQRITDLENAWHFESYDGAMELYFTKDKTAEQISDYLLKRSRYGNLCEGDRCYMVAPPKKEAEKPKKEAAARTGTVTEWNGSSVALREVLGSNEYVLLNFGRIRPAEARDHCPGCSKLEGPYKDVGRYEKYSNIPFIHIDSSHYGALYDEYTPEGAGVVPYVVLYKDGKIAASFSGSKSVEGLDAWLVQQTGR